MIFSLGSPVPSVAISPSIPHPRNPSPPHLPLQLKNTIQKRLRRRRTTGYINIHRHNPINTPNNTITVMIIAAPIRTTAHTDDPFRIRHLVVALAKRWAHFVGHGAGYDHHVGLAGGCAEDDS
jgi:hypothetical protein